ncbi:MAG: hypothetical protein ABEJ61_02360, partial [Haloferacaceae archaeon]
MSEEVEPVADDATARDDGATEETAGPADGAEGNGPAGDAGDEGTADGAGGAGHGPTGGGGSNGSGTDAATNGTTDPAAPASGEAPPAADADLPPDVRKYERFKKMDGAQYDRVNEFLRDRTYITAR